MVSVHHNALLICLFISYSYVYKFVVCITFESSAKVSLNLCISDFIYFELMRC